YLLNMAKKQRTGKIFLDYLRNDRLSTAVAPLSPRLREGAPVSMPLRWPQIKAGLDPTRYTMRTAPALIAKSKAWEDYCEAVRLLEPAIRKLVGPPSKRSRRAADSHARAYEILKPNGGCEVRYDQGSADRIENNAPSNHCHRTDVVCPVVRRGRGHRQGCECDPAARLRKQGGHPRATAPFARPRRSC